MFSHSKKSDKKQSIKTTYDTYNNEVMGLATSYIDGLKYEISKTLCPFFQLTSIGSYKTSKDTKLHQQFATLSFPNSIFQLSFDTNRNIQLKSSIMMGSFLTKFHSILSSNCEFFNQIESIYNTRLFNLGFKLIKPTIKASNLVYVFNAWRMFGSFCLGAEVVGIKNEMGISLSGRYDRSDNTVACFNLQRFNLLTLSFYKKLFGSIELGTEIKKGKDILSSLFLLRVRNYKSEVKCSINNKLNMGFSWCEKLSENLSFEFGSEYDVGGFNYGLGLSFES